MHMRRPTGLGSQALAAAACAALLCARMHGGKGTAFSNQQPGGALSLRVLRAAARIITLHYASSMRNRHAHELRA